MATLSRVATTYGMSLVLLLSLLLAMRGPHSPAIKRWFRAQFYGALVLELVIHVAGWDSDVYLLVYVPYTLVMFLCTGLVVLEAYEPS